QICEFQRELAKTVCRGFDHRQPPVGPQNDTRVTQIGPWHSLVEYLADQMNFAWLGLRVEPQIDRKAFRFVHHLSCWRRSHGSHSSQQRLRERVKRQTCYDLPSLVKATRDEFQLRHTHRGLRRVIGAFASSDFSNLLPYLHCRGALLAPIGQV